VPTNDEGREISRCCECARSRDLFLIAVILSEAKNDTRAIMKRVFMLAANSFFSQGIEALLCHTPGLEWVGHATELEHALQCMRALMPDVVIIGSGAPDFDSNQVAMRVMHEFPETRIVKLSLQDNTICVCYGERIYGVEDLIHAIENDHLDLSKRRAQISQPIQGDEPVRFVHSEEKDEHEK
jgi:chemotaxis response regulator CheB